MVDAAIAQKFIFTKLFLVYSVPSLMFHWKTSLLQDSDSHQPW